MQMTIIGKLLANEIIEETLPFIRFYVLYVCSSRVAKLITSSNHSPFVCFRTLLSQILIQLTADSTAILASKNLISKRRVTQNKESWANFEIRNSTSPKRISLFFQRITREKTKPVKKSCDELREGFILVIKEWFFINYSGEFYNCEVD